MTVFGRTASQLRQDIAAGSISAVEACLVTLDRVSSMNAALNAFNHVDADRALERAAAIDHRRAAGDRLGKTNCDEFAMGSSNENSAYGPVRNPWNLDTTPGGSSGGSAAAVAARCVPLALGSDTGGSIRQPASFCGVVGLKPTYGRVSRYGLLAFASSLDQIGPFACTVADAALALSVIAGHDACDSTSSTADVPDYTAALTGDIRGVRIGVPRAFVSEGVDAPVRAAFDRALDTLRDRGATLIDIDLPHAKLAIPVYYLIATAEASSNLARYDGVKYGYRSPAAKDSLKAMYSKTRDEGFGAEVKRRIMLGTYVLSAASNRWTSSPCPPARFRRSSLARRPPTRYRCISRMSLR